MPTPTIQIYIQASEARGGLSITASHNPAEYNALKLFNGEGLFLNSYERSELIDLYHQSQFRHVPNTGIGTVTTDYEQPPAIHLEKVMKQVDAERIRGRRFRVALDAVNGAGSLMSVEFLQKYLSCWVETIHCDPTQIFPREAEPRPDTLTDLAKLVAARGCDVGFAQDPGADRLAVVAETGEVLDNDDVLALAVSEALDRRAGDVVINLSTSRAIEEIAAAGGRQLYRTPVGEANVVERMLAVEAAIGGEGSNGGVIYPAVHCCRDSFTGMAFVLDRMASQGKTVSELARELPRFYRRQGMLPFTHGRIGTSIQASEGAFPEALTDRTDGIKLDLPEGWIHVRPSNTEPLLRLSAEASTREGLKELYGAVERLLADPGEAGTES